MEEKIIIKSRPISTKKVFVICMSISVAIAVLLTAILYFAVYLPDYEMWYDYHNDWSTCRQCDGTLTADACAKECVDSNFIWFTLLLPPVAGYIISAIFCSIISFITITVTNKRVYGKTTLRHSVDLPLDSISSVGTSAFKSISVATSSGRISFAFIDNVKEIHEEIRKLLIERQDKKKIDNVNQAPVIATSTPDELKKYKELLDCGVITQEEFDAKKKQLLGL